MAHENLTYTCIYVYVHQIKIMELVSLLHWQCSNDYHFKK
jgi:hypothetical protein